MKPLGAPGAVPEPSGSVGVEKAAEIARADLRSYGLRRCIRFYVALVLLVGFVASSRIVLALDLREYYSGVDGGRLVGAIVFVALAIVEVLSGLVIRQLVRVRDQGGSLEKGLWRAASGPLGSWVATAFYLAAAWAIFALRGLT